MCYKQTTKPRTTKNTSLCVCQCASRDRMPCMCRSWWRADESVRYSGAEVIGSCEGMRSEFEDLNLGLQEEQEAISPSHWEHFYSIFLRCQKLENTENRPTMFLKIYLSTSCLIHLPIHLPWMVAICHHTLCLHGDCGGYTECILACMRPWVRSPAPHKLGEAVF